ncbi:hypothetical protein ETB97_000367 [Aspergillus alliaceus]|uniref:MARVEL domain-containing protein n=1 Tax=Petromyces alliaceus TaxID=209559 RepID=A0A5N7C215_PETAA|nr:hypothetical protein BDV23DRAFT_174320 [Aspergillus alliaceus]KAF5861330.1 hypothetical protein ETB97_000367 [Aspergillus burnettii]
MVYFPRNWRKHNLFYILMALEFPITIVILTFTGIASHDLYRTKLWQDGADNGFNSSPDEVLYAAANYRPYKVPMVWGSFITDYNLVLGVLSTFILITKLPVHILRVFYPPVSVFVHVGLFVVYIVSAAYQAGSDTSDPKHPQRGLPWYITKSCSVASNKNNVGYCQQAKALFAFSIIIIVLYFVEIVVSIHSCFLTEEEKAEREERREEKRTMKEYEDMVLKTPRGFPMSPALPTGGTQGKPTMSSCSPAFSTFGNGSSDLPLRDQFSTPNTRQPTQQESSETLAPGNQPQMYFPPPPKKAAKV